MFQLYGRRRVTLRTRNLARDRLSMNVLAAHAEATVTVEEDFADR